MCAEMFNKGIMSHLTVLIAKVSTLAWYRSSSSDHIFRSHPR
jgi:hypothetical protein